MRAAWMFACVVIDTLHDILSALALWPTNIPYFHAVKCITVPQSPRWHLELFFFSFQLTTTSIVELYFHMLTSWRLKSRSENVDWVPQECFFHQRGFLRFSFSLFIPTAARRAEDGHILTADAHWTDTSVKSYIFLKPILLEGSVPARRVGSLAAWAQFNL